MPKRKTIAELETRIEGLHQQLDISRKLLSNNAQDLKKAEESLKFNREIIADINQWSRMIVLNTDLRPRVIRGIVGSIYNRTTD